MGRRRLRCGPCIDPKCERVRFFMLDKYLAEERRRRIPESTLLFLALVGGSAGAIAAQQFWRHKTQKEPFRTMLFSIAGLHVLILAWLLMR
jgi:uncharacterized membrane protein YsdA (DUF1294 family)